MKKLLEKFSNKKEKIIGGIITAGAIMQNTVFADVSVSGSGGEIASSKIGKGVKSLVNDIAGYLQIIIPIIGVCMCLWYVFKILTGDEQDGQRYKKSIVKVLVCVIIAELAVVLINLLTKYFIS